MSTLANYQLSGRLRRTLRPLARVVCTPEVEQLGLTEQVLDHVELSLRSIPGYARLGLRLALVLFELGALLWPRALLRPFSRLPPELQERYFLAWWDGPSPLLRQLLKGVKGLLALAYWDHPEVRRRLEYHPEAWIAKVAAQRVQRFASEIAAHDALVVRPAPLQQELRPAAAASAGPGPHPDLGEQPLKKEGTHG